MLVEVGVEFLKPLAIFNEFFIESQDVASSDGLSLDRGDVWHSDETDMEGITFEVIQFVGAEVAVADPCAERMFICQHLLEELHRATACLDCRRHALQAEQTTLVVVLRENGLDLVGTGTVPQVMEQCEEFQGTLLVGVKMLNPSGLASTGQNTEGMLETRMLSTRENQVVQAQLTTMTQALEKRMVDDWQIIADLDGT